MSTSELVQPILVHNTAYGALEDMLSDSAIASVIASSRDPSFHDWYVDGKGQRKTARRIKTISKFESAINAIGDPIVVNHAVAGPISTYGEFAKPISKAQVSGFKQFDIVRSEEHKAPAFGTVLINDSLQMSPGKLIAQVAHALTIYYAETGFVPTIGDRIDIDFVADYYISRCDFIVVDNGHTEIPPGSVTCGFLPRDI